MASAGSTSAARHSGKEECPRWINVALVGTYAWGTTALAPAWSSGYLALLAAALAYVCLWVGVSFLRRHLPTAHAFGIGGFVGLSCVCWFLCGDAIAPTQMTAVGGALGALGWLLFALSWGVVRRAADVPEEDPLVIEAAPLRPRRPVSGWALPVVFGVTVVSGAPWMLAWGGERVPQTLFAHAAALAFLLAALWVASHLVTHELRSVTPTPAANPFAAAVPALALVLICAMLGVLYLLLRV